MEVSSIHIAIGNDTIVSDCSKCRTKASFARSPFAAENDYFVHRLYIKPPPNLPQRVRLKKDKVFILGFISILLCEKDFLMVILSFN
jgi:hypothetical protein